LYEKDESVFTHLQTQRENPYFFSWKKLPKNVLFERFLEGIIWDYDLVIIAIPAQFVVTSLEALKKNFKPGVIFLNLSKWINNKTLQTIGEWLTDALWSIDYHYSVLSGGMIADELVLGRKLWADIAASSVEIWEKLRELFVWDNLDIHLTQASTKSVELFGAIKNIMAICIWYYMWKWESYSTLWYYMCKLLDEEKALISLLKGWEYFEFSDYSLWGDIVASCFGNARNRLLWELLWQWNSAEEALRIMKGENKTAEWKRYYAME
jgi:glycerol-3-phosphate dehydrogenase